MDAPVALARSDWRRHDIVYSPDLKLYGTVSAVLPDDQCMVEWQSGVRLAHPIQQLDEWQRINDERGKP